MDFEWDAGNAVSNLAKHKLAFEEAATVFNDPLYIDLYDPDHSSGEQRYLIVGGISARSFVNCVLYGTEKYGTADQRQGTYSS